MKKRLPLVVCLVVLLCLVLALSAFNFGNHKVPDDQLRDLLESNLKSDRENAELTDFQIVSSKADAEGVNTVVADVTSQTEFATCQDRYTLELHYVESWKKWTYVSSDSVQRTPLKITPKHTPTVEEIPGIIEASQEEARGLLRVGEDQADSTIMPPYTVGEPVADAQNAEVAALLVPLDVDEQRYGWLVFHGTLQAELRMWSNTGEWELFQLTPGEGFAVTSVLDNQTYTSEAYELTLFGQDYPRQYTRTIRFGALDWNTMSFPGTIVTVTNQSEGGQETEVVEALLGGYYLSRGNPSVTVSVSGQVFAMKLPADEAETLQERDSDLLYTLQEAYTTAADPTQDPPVITTTYEKGYDGEGNVYTEYTVEFVYDEAGNLALLENVDGDGGYKEYFYDAENHKTAEQFFCSDGTVSSRSEFDANGNKVREILNGEETVDYTYDEKNRCILETNHTTFETTYTYDDSAHTGTSVKKDLRTNGTVSRTSQMTYDENWRLLTEKTQLADGETIHWTYTYDTQGNVVHTSGKWDVSGATTEEISTYDAYGNLTYGRRFSNGVIQWESSCIVKLLSQAKRVQA